MTISDRVFAVATAYGLFLAAVRIGSLTGNALVPRLHRSRRRLSLTDIFATASAAPGVAATGVLVGRVSLRVVTSSPS